MAIIRQDGASAHWSMEVRDFLTDAFDDNCFDRGELIAWPPSSPDVT
jgi:hypothetical protein